MGVVGDVGEVKLLNKLIGAEVWTVHLYVNDKTPVNGDTAAQYTEPVWMGYNPIALSQPTVAATNAAGKAQLNFAQVQWALTMDLSAAINCYGWYVTDQDNTFIGAERFTSPPLVLQHTGDNIKLTVSVTLSSDPPNP